MTTSLGDRIPPDVAMNVVMTGPVGVVGLGMAGLYQALEFWHRGFTVIGYDTDEDRVRGIRSGSAVLPDLDASVIIEALRSQRLLVGTDPGVLRRCPIVLISVPTDVDDAGKPDTTNVVAATTVVADNCRPGVLVIVKSTSYPGMVREVADPILAARFGAAGHDYYLGYAPERGDPGNRDFASTSALPKVVAGRTPACTARVSDLYRHFTGAVHAATGLEVAELVKLHENVFRFINIAYVNELAALAARLGADIGEVVDLAATKPFGFMPFSPGTGVGGMYVPINPRYLLAAADAAGCGLGTVETALRVNDTMPATVVDLIRRSTGDLCGRRLLVLGVTYKPGSGDLRRSPALAVVAEMTASARVTVVDPYVRGRRLPGLDLIARDLTDVDPIDHDLAVVLVAHPGFAAFTTTPPIPCVDAMGRRYPRPAPPGGVS